MRSTIYQILFSVLLYYLSIPISARAQKIVLATGGVLYGLDSGSEYCSYSQLQLPGCFLDLTGGGSFSVAMHKDTLYFTDLDNILYMSTLNSQAVCVKLDMDINTNAMTADKDGFLYWVNGNNLIRYDPRIRQQYDLGVLNYGPLGDLVFFENHLIMASTGGLVDVNIANPGQSTYYLQDTTYGFYGLANISTPCNRGHILGFTLPGNTVMNLTSVIDIDMYAKTFQYKCHLPFDVEDAAGITDDGVLDLADTTINSIDTVACSGTQLLLDAGNIPGASFLWDDNSTQQTINVNASGRHWVSISDSGCLRADTINCVFISGPQFYLPKDTIVCEPGPQVLQPLITLSNQPANTYLWQDGSTQAAYSASQSGIYILQATDMCGSVTDTVKLTFEDCRCTFYIPDAFTPNHDGINDIFTPKPICNLDATVSGYQFRIYNRWGQQVFNTRQVNAGWDGRYKGVMQAEGGYPWEIQYLDRFGRKVKRSGTVILIR